jgi:hypothetical protein
MARLIDADSFVDLLKSCFPPHGKVTMDVLVAAIDGRQTVDAAPVVHGHWELHGNDDDVGSSYWCSVCHKHHKEEWSDGEWEFCPHCGAIMDEEANHE